MASYDYDGGNVPLAAEVLSPRTVRLTFAVTPVPGSDLVMDVDDRAGNASGSLTRTVSAADATVTEGDTSLTDVAVLHELSTASARDVARVDVQEAPEVTLTLMFDPEHNLEERVLREQFAP